MHKNWRLLRLLPFFVGQLVPPDEPAWQVPMDLKDMHKTESTAYLQSKISDHQSRLQEGFLGIKLLPKHHYMEHYLDDQIFWPVSRNVDAKI